MIVCYNSHIAFLNIRGDILKKSIAYLFLLALLLLITFLADTYSRISIETTVEKEYTPLNSSELTNKHDPEDHSEEARTPIEVSEITKTSNNATITGTYTGHVSLEELKSLAELIVMGTVIEDKSFNRISAISTIKVEKTYKGVTYDTIYIYRLNNLESYLTPNEAYILFLGKQGDSSEDSFYVMGGTQGAMRIKGEELIVKDYTMMEQLEKLKSNSSKNTLLRLMDEFLRKK